MTTQPVMNRAAPGYSLAYRNISLLNTGIVILATPGVVRGWCITNNAAAARFVKLYDKATTPSGADTPFITIQIPASSSVSIAFDSGILFSSGISIRSTTLVADADNTAPTANDIVANVFYR